MSANSARVRMKPLPVCRTPSDIGHETADPSVACQRDRSLPGPSRTSASLGGATDVSGPGLTTTGRGRLLSCTRHFPSGCIGVSSYPMLACWPRRTMALRATATTAAKPVRDRQAIFPPGMLRALMVSSAAAVSVRAGPRSIGLRNVHSLEYRPGFQGLRFRCPVPR